MRRPHVTAAIVYAAATVLYFCLILADPTRMVSFLYGDGFAVLWNFWWANRSVTTLQSPFVTDLLSWPHEASLVFHPLDLFDGVLTIPFQHLLPGTSGLVLGLNVVGIGCFFVSALVMYGALWRLSGAWLPALIGGFAYSFSAFHFRRIENPILGAMYWLPLYTVLYLRAAEGRDWKRWSLAGLCFGLCPFQSLYYWLFLGLLTPFLFVVALLRTGQGRRAVPRLLLLTLAIGACALPVVTLGARDLARVNYLAEGAKVTEVKVLGDDLRNSVDVAGLVIPGLAQGIWRPFAPGWNQYLKKPTVEWQFGGENGAGGNFAYVGVVPLVLFAVGLIAGPRRMVVPWGIAAAVFLGLALGPHLHVYGEVYTSAWLPLPYRLVLLAPTSLTKMFRAPFYFFAPGLFALWVVAAFGVCVLLRRWGSRRGALALLVWLVLDYAGPPVRSFEVVVPAGYERIAADPRPIKVVDVPLFEFFGMEYYSFLQTVHGKPLVRGYIGRRDPWIARRDEMLLNFFSHGELDSVLVSLGPSYVVVHKEEWLRGGPWNAALMASIPAFSTLEKVHDDELVTVYTLQLPPPPPG